MMYVASYVCVFPENYVMCDGDLLFLCSHWMICDSYFLLQVHFSGSECVLIYDKMLL